MEIWYDEVKKKTDVFTSGTHVLELSEIYQAETNVLRNFYYVSDPIYQISR